MEYKEIEALKKAIMLNLDNKDKRIMFLTCCFPSYNIILEVQVEGGGINCTNSIYRWFETKSMLGSLMACMNSVFNTNLTLTV